METLKSVHFLFTIFEMFAYSLQHILMETISAVVLICVFVTQSNAWVRLHDISLIIARP